MALAETLVPLAKTPVPLAKTIVHTREVTVKSATVEPPAAAPAMRPSVGEIWLAERGSA